MSDTAEKRTSYEVGFPVAFHTVDMAIIKSDFPRLQILLCQKKKEQEIEELKDKWRFPGGFVDPSDESAEGAALREALEETGMKFSPQVRYIGSAKMDGDKRYTTSPHKIITSFYELLHTEGPAGKGYDDIAVTKWFYVDEITEEIKNPVHLKLFKMIEERYKVYITMGDMHKDMADSAKKTAEELDSFCKSLVDQIDTMHKDFTDALPEIKREAVNAVGHIVSKTKEVLNDIFKK